MHEAAGNGAGGNAHGERLFTGLREIGIGDSGGLGQKNQRDDYCRFHAAQCMTNVDRL
jgi:hypothetical protein